MTCEMMTRTKLFNYQLAAYEKLSKLKVGALYMDMGVGKTRTMLEIIITKLKKRKVNHVLWLCPVSVKTTLNIDIKKHTDGVINYITIMGIESLSQSDRTYLQALDLVREYDCMLVIDESHKVKNWQAKRTQRAITLASYCSYRYILTGTPVSRNEADLFSQWYILDKRIFGYRSYHNFSKNHLEYDEHGKIVNVLNVEHLTKKMTPYTYIIKKEDIVMDLKGKIYETVYFDLEKDQNKCYQETKNRLLTYIEESDEYDRNLIFKLFTALQLISSGREVYEVENNKKVFHQAMYKNPLYNPRIEMLKTLIEDETEKTIIWCKYQFEIEEVEQLMKHLNKSYVLLTGKITLENREKNLIALRNNVQFLIANIGVGGTGLNLQFINRAIYYSNGFDWGNRTQSEDRIYRIGQDRTVYITSIYSTASIDKIIEKNLENKESLANCINRFLKENNLKEVL